MMNIHSTSHLFSLWVVVFARFPAATMLTFFLRSEVNLTVFHIPQPSPQYIKHRNFSSLYYIIVESPSLKETLSRGNLTWNGPSSHTWDNGLLKILCFWYSYPSPFLWKAILDLQKQLKTLKEGLKSMDKFPLEGSGIYLRGNEERSQLITWNESLPVYKSVDSTISKITLQRATWSNIRREFSCLPKVTDAA